MNRKSYLILHKTEWDRLKRRPSPEERNTVNNDYLQALIEQSQSWMKTWPDTVQGHVYHLEKQKEIEHAELIATVKKFMSRKKQEIKMESIRRARKMIFEDSCYGRQLLSALLESKCLEEREQQVLFQKKVKQKTDLQKQTEPKTSSLQSASEMESNEKRLKLVKKQRDLDVARMNLEIAKQQRNNKMKEKEKNKGEAYSDEILEKGLQEQEKKIKVDKIKLEKRLIEEYETDKKEIVRLRKQKEDEDERTRELYQKYRERIKNTEKYIFNEINKNKNNTLHVHDIIKNINDEKIKHYNDFVNKGVKRLINKEEALEKAENERNNLERNKRMLLDEENKELAKLHYQLKSLENTKDVCCRQILIRNSCNRPKNNNERAGQPQPSRKKLLVEDLKRRQKEPSPWSSLNTAHNQFAEHADETIKECRFKHNAQKVINDYRKINCLDAKSLPIKEY